MSLYVFMSLVTCVCGVNLNYLDPVLLQTVIPSSVQRDAASNIIRNYAKNVVVEVDPLMFYNHKDVFYLRTIRDKLFIKSSSGVAAVWGFNYYLKKYCQTHIAWQVRRVSIPDPLPEVDEIVVANDRFRYYQNVCTASYSFVWWDIAQWKEHIEWMALNGINLALAPVAQEAVWARIYRDFGMTDEEIRDHFTGPAFLAWLRMGNVHGWGGPLLNSWHDKQKTVQNFVIRLMVNLGMVPVFPAFNGHVPKAFGRIYPNNKFHMVQKWNKFNEEYCCGLFLDPSEPLFKRIGDEFLRHIDQYNVGGSHIFTADPFNEVKIPLWSTSLVVETAKAIYYTLSHFDEKAVWLLQNWMFVSAPILWPISRVEAFLTAVPNGRMLILDLQSEQWPQYYIYSMYYGQPFIWCMLHNFGGTLGLFGNMKTINRDVYEARKSKNSTMIGVGITPEGINQNYVVYDLMLENGWRSEPVPDMNKWISEYAERRYGCASLNSAWRYLLRSVYSFNGLNMVRGKYVITRRPSFRIRPWAWYRSLELFDAFRIFAFADDLNCSSETFNYDLVDVTRQALQYRAEQIYLKLLERRLSTTWVFNASITQFLDVMNDMSKVLSTSEHFSIENWQQSALAIATNKEEMYTYQLNARNQITLWGPNGEISDYACKQWAELFTYYYIPRWSTFLNAALDAKMKNESFDERSTQNVVRATVEDKFVYANIQRTIPSFSAKEIAMAMYKKWANVPGLDDLPISSIKSEPHFRTTLPDVETSTEEVDIPDVLMIFPTSKAP